MAAIAIVVTAVLAVAGWLVSQAQARRAARRNMRVSYLLDTYRRLDRASNRQLNPEYDRELEAAISDVWGYSFNRSAQLRSLPGKVRSGRVEPTTSSDDVQLPKLLRLHE